MSDGGMQKKVVLGILMGAGVGFATAPLLAPQHRTRLRTALIEGARDAAERVTCLAQGPRAWHDRKVEREARTLETRWLGGISNVSNRSRKYRSPISRIL